MSYLTDSDIEHIARHMLACTLPEAAWTHQAHFAAALWLLRREGDCCFNTMPDYIRRYNLALGNQNTDMEGYHETITIASLRATRHWLRTSTPDAPLSQILTGLMASKLGRSDWLFEYWKRETVFSVKARHEWVEPDIRPLPYPAV